MIRKILLTVVVLLVVKVLVALPDKLSGYLFVYFESNGNDAESIRFAVSDDAINWKALNNNNPILKSESISTTGGVRDPHILRGEDGLFYMVATDMSANKNGWVSNPGVVLLKSNDLINWDHTILDFPTLFPKTFANVKYVWAPQTIYDVQQNKYMIYFSVKFHEHDSKLAIYYAYINDDFTGLDSEPKVLFAPDTEVLDADIIEKDGIFHLFYKGHQVDASGVVKQHGIMQATSKQLSGKYIPDGKFIDVYAKDLSTKVEGSGIFKLNDKEDYVLMYDVYSSKRYEFQRSSDLIHFSDKAESFQKDFTPRHGSIIGITKQEARRLNNRWGGVSTKLLQPTGSTDKYDFNNNGNPIIRHHFTADPAAMVHNDTLWLYTGHDYEGNQAKYRMYDWLVFSTTDMMNWTEHEVPLRISDFEWAKSNGGKAYAGHVTEKNGKFYFYVSTEKPGIGVAVSDNPAGPFKDALGKPLITKADCFASSHGWCCIDPAIYTDSDGTSWIFWGNRECYYAKLKDNMIELDGEIKQVHLKDENGLNNFTEAPWIHKNEDTYYLSYASGFPETIVYATAKNIEGPWQYGGLLNEVAGNSNTNHQSIINFKGDWYFMYHTGALQHGGSSYSRSVCSEFLQHKKNGQLQRIQMSTEGSDLDYYPNDNVNNPIIKGYYADPEIIYSEKDQKYYIYPTSDGFYNWRGTYFEAFSSTNLKDWNNEGVILDLPRDISWANERPWAPTAIERKINGSYRYFYYYTADGNIGVAVSDSPKGPFTDPLGKPLIDFKPEGVSRGAVIDPDIFHDPISNKYYLYWGNGFVGCVELNDDMISIKQKTMQRDMRPDASYREGLDVFFRNGKYYFLWSEDDTRSENYKVRYAYSDSPTGKLTIPKNNIVIQKRLEDGIFGAGHHSVFKKQNSNDEWYIVYHRFRRPNAVKMGRSGGYHREICMDKLEFSEDGTIKEVYPTL
ncbi:MAG: family 43 glycosylhydrolase [Mangrovibacterium sp.]